VQRRILVVDDDPDTRNLLQMVLELEGYAVDTAANGLDALQRARQIRPDVIILDLMMPLMDGCGFRAAQMQDPRLANVPVVLTSASATLERDTSGLSFSASFAKPLELDMFSRTVRELCRKGRAA
jgi:two-component system response regulator MprA